MSESVPLRANKPKVVLDNKPEFEFSYNYYLSNFKSPIKNQAKNNKPHYIKNWNVDVPAHK